MITITEAERTPYKNAWQRNNRDKTRDQQKRYWVRRAIRESQDQGRIDQRTAEELEVLLCG